MKHCKTKINTGVIKKKNFLLLVKRIITLPRISSNRLVQVCKQNLGKIV